MQTHKQLRVWQQSIELAKQVHFLCARYPREELFALTSQMNRAAVSIASNIAEGYGRDSAKELYRFLAIAQGSASELETQLILSREFGYLTEEEFYSLAQSVTAILKMLAALRRRVHDQCRLCSELQEV